MTTLATDYKNHLSTFLAQDQVSKIEKRLMKKKGKRKGKKEKKEKVAQPE
jgi:hypothetical protein